MKNKDTSTYQLIKETIEIVSGVKDISNTRRTRRDTELRWVYYDLCKRYLKGKFVISHCALVVNRHHASVINGIKVFKDVNSVQQFKSQDVYNKAVSVLNEYLVDKYNDDDRLIILAKINYLENCLSFEKSELEKIELKIASKMDVIYKAV